MGIDDLAMDLQSLHRILTKMQVPVAVRHDYANLIPYLNQNHKQDPNYQAALNLTQVVLERLNN